MKLSFGAAPEVSAKELAEDKVQEAALKGIQRSLMWGTALSVGGCAAGWHFAMWWHDVKDLREFGALMHEKMPKVSGDLQDSRLGRSLKKTGDASRDAIAESAGLAEWRRSVRGKFNTPEGAKIARANSIILAEQRRLKREDRVRARGEQAEEAAEAASAEPGRRGSRVLRRLQTARLERRPTQSEVRLAAEVLLAAAAVEEEEAAEAVGAQTEAEAAAAPDAEQVVRAVVRMAKKSSGRLGPGPEPSEPLLAKGEAQGEDLSLPLDPEATILRLRRTITAQALQLEQLQKEQGPAPEGGG